MSASTRSCARSLALLALVVATQAWPADEAKAPPLPPKVMESMPHARMMGGGAFTFYGLSVYDGYYWSPSRVYSPLQPFALDLHYRRSLKGVLIAERSVAEITHLGYGTPDERARWGSAMKLIFPNVDEGDRITGVNVPGVGARFFFNGKLIGEIAEPTFAQAFFGIWLDPKTSRPDFRKQLLGE